MAWVAQSEAAIAPFSPVLEQIAIATTLPDRVAKVIVLEQRVVSLCRVCFRNCSLGEFDYCQLSVSCSAIWLASAAIEVLNVI